MIILLFTRLENCYISCNHSGCQVHGSGLATLRSSYFLRQLMNPRTAARVCLACSQTSLNSLGDMYFSEVIRFKVHGWLPYLHTGLCSSFFNLEPWNCEPEKFLVSVSSGHSPSQVLASLLDGTLFESIHVPVAKPQYLQTVQSSLLPNHEP